MPAPATTDDFLDLVRKSDLVDTRALDDCVAQMQSAGGVPEEPKKLAGMLVRDGILAVFQAEQLLAGRWKGFNIGKYRVLERLGSGGGSNVYLCENPAIGSRVAVKVLYSEQAADANMMERFRREARAAATLNHPNIVRGFDLDQDGSLTFLVMEYIEGASLERVIRKQGPMDVIRACHYIKQAAQGLLHACEHGLVHRDIKPANLLLDRQGVVRILDMGLARFTQEENFVLTQQDTVLGTADYIAPEQTRDSHRVDIRADIYSLGATFYFMLTGRTAFPKGSVAQKLIWLQTQEPPSISLFRPEVPEELVKLVEKMMAKDPMQRFTTPADVIQALAPWTATPIDPPPEAEMPKLSLVAQGLGSGNLRRPSPAAVAQAQAQVQAKADSADLCSDTAVNSTTATPAPTRRPRRKNEEPVLQSQPFAPPPFAEDADYDRRKQHSARPRRGRGWSAVIWLFGVAMACLLTGAIGFMVWRTFFSQP